MSDMLPLKKGREIDIEAVALSGGRLWWAGSHGQNSNGKKRPNRRKLFSTNIPNRNLSDLTIIDKPVDLIDAFENESLLGEYFDTKIWKLAPKKGGINIEGIAFNAAGDLLVGLRSPLSRKKGLKGNALVVTLTLSGKKWDVTKVTELDLGDRGIRDIAVNGDEFLVIAGDVDANRPTSLYSWNGSDAVEEIPVEGISDINPEAITQIGHYWLMLSDDGRVRRRLFNLDGAVEETCGEISEDNARHPGVYFRGLLFSTNHNQ